MRILAIETSADETTAAITEERRVLSNIISSQIETHAKWGGIYPSLAKRAHEEKIDPVVNAALKNFGIKDIDYIAVTYGPGLAVALEVGIKKAKELAKTYNKQLIAVNHLEGHIYSCFVQNSKGNPKHEFKFPYLSFVISGGHTEIVLFRNHCDYKVLGETLDDAAGEALDKAAKMLGLGYPGGPVIERLAKEVENKDFYRFPRPMLRSNDLNFSFSGLKTSFFYFLKKNNAGIQLDRSPIESGMTKKLMYGLRQLASSYQEAVFDTIMYKAEKAIRQSSINQLTVGGGVSANLYLRKKFRQLVKKYDGTVLFPPFKYLTGDNAAMIGVAAYYKAQKNMFVKNIDELDRVPRLSL
jgi:N6-L-threonylcarbamoyladenine synthase